MIRRVAYNVGLISTKLCGPQRLSFRKSFYVSSSNLFACQYKVPIVLTMTSVTPEKNLNYQDIKKIIETKKGILIDVREPKELEESGKLPNSTNIPLGEVKTALELPPDKFLKKYGIPQPSKDTSLVFSCRSGGRSTKALQTALELGFINSKHYAGGFLDWEKNSKK